jgi:hypothetical protein
MSRFSLVLLEGRRKHKDLLDAKLLGRDVWGEVPTAEAVTAGSGRPSVRIGRRYTAISDATVWGRANDVEWSQLSQQGCAMCLVYDSVSTAFLLMVWEGGLLVRHVEGSADYVERDVGTPLPEEVRMLSKLARLGDDPAIDSKAEFAFPAASAEHLLYGVSVRVLGARLDRLMETWTTPWTEYEPYEPGAELSQPAPESTGCGPELLVLLQAKGLVEFAPDAALDDIGETLESALLTEKDPHSLATQIIEQLVQHPDVAEVYATEDQLAPLLAEW